MPIACFHMPNISGAAEQARRPDLQGQPCALVSGSGLLHWVSDEARPFGIKPGLTVTGARALCGHLLTCPYDREAYDAAARPAWDALAIESSCVEPVSPEVCYAEMTGRQIPARMRRLTAKLAESAGTCVQAGMGTGKLVAYHAALCTETFRVVAPGEEAAFLASVQIEAIPAIDERLCLRLQRLSIRTLGDIRALPLEELRRSLGSAALFLFRLARGQDGARVRPIWPPRSTEAEVRFDYEVSGLRDVREALRRNAAQIAAILRTRREFARRLSVRITLCDGGHVEQGEKPGAAIDTLEALHGAAMRIFHRMQPRLTQPLAAIRLQASELSAGSAVQLDLIDAHGNALPSERLGRLNAALRRLRARYGAAAPVPAQTLLEPQRSVLWANPLGRKTNTPLRVETDNRDCPIRFWRTGSPLDVTCILGSWRETEWSGKRLTEKTVFRVQTGEKGLYELHRTEAEWRLEALAD